jgi:hypothetical protein
VSVLAALAVALIAWSVRGVSQKLLAVVLAGSGVALAVGAVLGLALYPWTDLPVLGFAVAGGVLVGRRLSPRPMPMLVLLAVLAVLDVIQIVALGSGPSPARAGGAAPASYSYGMLVLDTPWTHSGVGIFDVLVIAAMVEHARRRGLPFAVGAAPGVLAFVAADVAFAALAPRDLPLIPFLLAGWLAIDLVVRIAAVPGQSETTPTAR